ncbi:MAG TPA: DHA2 family efflux MFS transporter permease subunit [Solirubrobacteraceae bacterium]
MNSTVQSQAAATPQSRRWWALAVLAMAQFVTILDAAIVNVALPSIQRDLHFSQGDLPWVITAYTILFGGTLLLGGRLGDLFGRRRLFVVGMLLFTAASLFNGLAWNDVSLIAGRGVQGFGAALLVPAALSMLVRIFPEGRDRNRALSIWAAVSAGGGSFGLLLGGVLTQALSWRWIFFINLPIGAVVIALTPLFLPESRDELAARRFDFLGAASITGGLMLLVYALTRASQQSWTSTEPLVLFAGSVALIAAFVVIEARSDTPLLPLRIFRLRTLAGSNVSGLFSGIGYVVFFLGSLYAQVVLGYSPIETGAAFLAVSLSIILGAGIAQSLVGRLGVRRLVPTGFVLAAAGLLLLARAPVNGHYLPDLFPAFVVFGLGVSLAFVGQQIGAQMGVAPADAGIASGLINTTQQVGGAIAVAVGTTIAAHATLSYAAHHPGAHQLHAEALTHGYQLAFYVFAAVSLLAAVLISVTLESKPAETKRAPSREETPELGAA